MPASAKATGLQGLFVRRRARLTPRSCSIAAGRRNLGAPSGRGSPKDAGSRTSHFFYSPSQRLVRNISAVVVPLVRSNLAPYAIPPMGDRVAGEGRYGADA